MKDQLRVLMVEDSENDALLLIRRLINAGFAVMWQRVQEAESMKTALRDKQWDLVLSDYSMPNFDGLKALKIYQQEGLDIPFILVSAMVGEELAVNAMIEGAHDYLMKDKLERLVPAVRRELREAQIRKARRQAEKEIVELNESLERRVIERTQQLEAANKELKAAQNELIRREKMALLGQLTATVSHELRNPLGVIRSSNYYLQRIVKDTTPKTIKHFKRIDAQILLCEAMVVDLLEYTRSDSISAANQRLVLWMSQLAAHIAEKEGVAIELQLPEDLPPVPHDRERMIKAITNLLTNAVQAVKDRAKDTPGGHPSYQPEIVVSAWHEADQMVIEVRDNGIGMNAETSQRAFEPLFTTRARGIGIGLANVKKIVEEHGGCVSLESRPGEGTRATLRLPCAPPP